MRVLRDVRFAWAWRAGSPGRASRPVRPDARALSAGEVQRASPGTVSRSARLREPRGAEERRAGSGTQSGLHVSSDPAASGRLRRSLLSCWRRARMPRPVLASVPLRADLVGGITATPGDALASTADSGSGNGQPTGKPCVDPLLAALTILLYLRRRQKSMCRRATTTRAPPGATGSPPGRFGPTGWFAWQRRSNLFLRPELSKWIRWNRQFSRRRFAWLKPGRSRRRRIRP